MSNGQGADRNDVGTANEVSGSMGAVVQAGSIAGGVHLHSASPSPIPPPHELPPDVHAFTDRVDQLAEMDLLLASIEGSPATAAVVISAVSGTAGVGKTAFATHWAHRVSGRFPDGQLYVNLRGFDPAGRAVTAQEALANMLRSLNVPVVDIPHELDDRAARFRSVTAGRRMLIVLDNARSADQVRPLLPGTSSCLVLVTSRDTLPGLVSRDGARRMNLDLLPEAQAVGLLRGLIGERVDNDLQATRELVQHCARLPLALRVAADLVLSNEGVPLSELVAELADEENRLDLLDAGMDPYTAVRAVFSWSYRSLTEEEGRALRLLGLHPGRDFDSVGAAALIGTVPTRATKLLDSLVRSHLVERTANKRYQMHDLLRVYAADLASQEESEESKEAALGRLLDSFLQRVAMAMDVAFPQERQRRPNVQTASQILSFDTEAQALSWLEADRATVLALAARVADSTWAVYITKFSGIISRFLDVHGHFDDAVTLHSYAVSAARRQRDAVEEGRALHNIGTIYQRLGRYQDAVEQLEAALAALHGAGKRGLEAVAGSDLGLVLLLLGRYDDAMRRLDQALVLFQRLGDPTGQGQVLNNMGLALVRQGSLGESLDFMQQSLVLFRVTNDRPRQGYALNDIGVVFRRLGRRVEALEQHGEALLVAREAGDRALEAAALNGMGVVNLLEGGLKSALTYHQKALDIAVAIGDRYEQAQALEGLGDVYYRQTRTIVAREHWGRALLVYIELGAPEVDGLRQRLACLEA